MKLKVAKEEPKNRKGVKQRNGKIEQSKKLNIEKSKY